MVAMPSSFTDASPVHWAITLQDLSRRPGVAAYVIVPDERYIIGCGLLELSLSKDIVSYRIVCDMVAKRLAHASEPLAADRYYWNTKLFRCLLCYRLDIVTDKANRTFREDTYPFCEREEFLQFMKGRIESLVAAVDDVLLLKVGRNVHGAEGIYAGNTVIVVSPRPPAVLAATDGAMAYRKLVLHRPPDNALGSGIGAAPDSHDAGPRLYVRLHLTGAALPRRVICRQVLRPVLLCLGGINIEDLLDHLLRIFNCRAHCSSSVKCQCRGIDQRTPCSLFTIHDSLALTPRPLRFPECRSP